LVALIAAVSFVSKGLLLAAVATGSLTMSCAEPGPCLGTWSQAGRRCH
jgi:hypothetical protein